MSNKIEQIKQAIHDSDQRGYLNDAEICLMREMLPPLLDFFGCYRKLVLQLLSHVAVFEGELDLTAHLMTDEQIAEHNRYIFRCLSTIQTIESQPEYQVLARMQEEKS